jgi:hypothetical protein
MLVTIEGKETLCALNIGNRFNHRPQQEESAWLRTIKKHNSFGPYKNKA